jgi:molybdopterin converting factor small subunit
MTTRVRLFAAIRDAAGAAEIEVAATSVADLMAELGERYGDLMRRRLTAATVMVDGERVSKDDTAPRLVGATEVVVMPPFAGG